MKCTVSSSLGAGKLRIIDIQGKELIRATSNLSEGIDIQSLTPGMYLVEIKNSTSNTFQKFIKN